MWTLWKSTLQFYPNNYYSIEVKFHKCNSTIFACDCVYDCFIGILPKFLLIVNFFVWCIDVKVSLCDVYVVWNLYFAVVFIFAMCFISYCNIVYLLCLCIMIKQSVYCMESDSVYCFCLLHCCLWIFLLVKL